MNNKSSKSTEKLSSPLELYRNLTGIAGEFAPKLRRNLLLQVITSISAGLVYSTLYPIFYYIGTGDSSKVFHWIIIMSILFFINLLLRWFANGYDFDGSNTFAIHDLRLRLGEKLKTIPLEVLYSKRSGELSDILIGKVDESISFTSTMVGFICSAFLTPITIAIITFFIDWRVALIMLLVFPMSLPLYNWRRPAWRRGFAILGKAQEEMKAELIDFTQGIIVLKSVNMEEKQMNSYQKSSEKVKEIQMIGEQKGYRPNLIMAAVAEIGILLTIVLGAVWVINGSLAVMVLAAVVVILSRFGEAISMLVNLTSILEIFEQIISEINDILAIESLPVIDKKDLPNKYNISFENVSFSYKDTNKPVLNNISFEIPSEDLTAIVGVSGSGKTTITKLISRFADPSSGSIKIGGVNIKSMELSELMQFVTVVFQDVYLFNDTIENNIRIAKPEATQEEIIEASKLARCHDFVEKLPDGYGSMVGDIGGKLSGGERQRISIARALLKDAPIVILDEPTAALDVENEYMLQKAIDSLVKSRTVIVIAHRLSTIMGANKIIVIEDGKKSDEGTHEELIHKVGLYKKLWDTQMEVKNIRLKK